MYCTDAEDCYVVCCSLLVTTLRGQRWKFRFPVVCCYLTYKISIWCSNLEEMLIYCDLTSCQIAIRGRSKLGNTDNTAKTKYMPPDLSGVLRIYCAVSITLE
jgi:hypothetical protein